MAKLPLDPLRARLLELLQVLGEHSTQLRDYATAPGNAWLARGELQQIGQVVSDLEMLLEEIKRADEENGY